MKPHLSSVLSDEVRVHMAPGCMEVVKNAVMNRKPTDSISVSMLILPGGKNNKAFSKISGRLVEYCRDSVVLHGETVITQGEHHSIYDLATYELRHLIDYFSA